MSALARERPLCLAEVDEDLSTWRHRVLRALIADCGHDPTDQRGARPCVAAVPGLLTAARRSRSLIGWLLLAGYG